MSDHYNSDDALPQSPGLTAFRPKTTPSPTPPPEVTLRPVLSPIKRRTSSTHHPRQKKLTRRNKTKPSPGDFVLIMSLDPNQPDVARDAGAYALNSDSDSEEMDDDEPLSPAHEQMPLQIPFHPSRPAENSGDDLRKLAHRALDVQNGRNPVFKVPRHRDSVVEIDGQDRHPLSADPSRSGSLSTGPLSNGAPSRLDGARSPTFNSTALRSSPITERRASIANGPLPSQPLAVSSSLHVLPMPPRRASDVPRLPALQTPQSPPLETSAASPIPTQQLPPFRHLSDLAESAAQEQENNRAQLSHRQSISSIGQSPTSVSRQLSITSLSPASAFSLSATSPGSSSDIQSRDPFWRSGHQIQFLNTRRPSQASDNAPYSASLQSTTTNESYQSSDGLSPGSQGPRLSIDSTITSRTLPPPVGSNIQHIPSQGSGGFKCDHAGCTAPPFQTQYLLNSHANVHSQSRNHFCPVPDCPRSEGGKGFKRKNEMIRHGLVHASPGYVCPFCPDREHKYPRPDNLQRHVRVHHPEKDKDDAQLREVLAQRPEGGSRGRRRRVS